MDCSHKSLYTLHPFKEFAVGRRELIYGNIVDPVITKPKVEDNLLAVALGPWARPLAYDMLAEPGSRDCAPT